MKIDSIIVSKSFAFSEDLMAAGKKKLSKEYNGIDGSIR